MNKEEQYFLDTAKNIIETGIDSNDRTGVGTKYLFSQKFDYDISDGKIPIWTTRKIPWKNQVWELIWFMRGDTNIKFLKDRGVNIWDSWADERGNLGPLYGKQFRNWHNIELIEKRHKQIDDQKIESPYSTNIELDYSINKSNLVGKKFNSKTGAYIVIKENTNPRTYNVKFIETGYEIHNLVRHDIEKQSLEDRYKPSFMNIGCLGEKVSKEDYELLYQPWTSMIRRCYDNSHTNSSFYKFNGVFVEKQWLIFSNFVKDVKKIPNFFLKKEFPDLYSLDKDYYGANCYGPNTTIWLSKTEQNLNQEKTMFFKAIKDENEIVTLGVKPFCDKFNLCSTSVYNALKENKEFKGWKFQKLNTDKLVRMRIFDQVNNLIANIKNNPESRRHIISCWNVPELENMKLMPCHSNHIQIVVNAAKKDLYYQYVQRSADFLIGYCPWQHALFANIIGQLTGYKPKQLSAIITNCHIYKDQFEAAEKQISRTPTQFPVLKINKKLNSITDVENSELGDYELVDYNPQSFIKFPIAV